MFKIVKKNKKKTEHYENNKKALQEQVRKTYWKLCNKEKEIKIESGRNRYRNMSEETKQKLREYQKRKKNKNKNYCEVKKKLLKKIIFCLFSIKDHQKDFDLWW